MEEEEVVPAAADTTLIDVLPRPPPVYSSVASTAVTYRTGKSQFLTGDGVVEASLQVMGQCGTRDVLRFKVASHCAEYARQVKQESQLWRWDALRATVDQYQVTDKVLGAGSFGRVTLGTCSGAPVACKTWRGSNFAAIRREIAMLTLLAHKQHHNVCHIVGWTDAPEFRIFLELCAGSLAKLIRGRSIHEAQQWAILSQVCSALCHLHSLTIVHMDLKSDNVLVVGNVSRGQLPWVKVADVGMGHWRSQNNEEQSVVLESWKIKRPWRAPEMAAGIASTPVDMFAFGCLVVEVVRGSQMTDEDVTIHQRMGPQKPQRCRPPARADHRSGATGFPNQATDVGHRDDSRIPLDEGGEPEPRVPPEPPVVATWVKTLVDEAPEPRPSALTVARWLAHDCSRRLHEYERWLRTFDTSGAAPM